MHTDMNLASSCKKKLEQLRIKDLKNVLTQLGLARQGKKQELMDRILALVSDVEISNYHGSTKKLLRMDEVAKLIDDAYRKTQTVGTTDLVVQLKGGSELSCLTPQKEENFLNADIVICCPCGSTLCTQFMVQCADSECHVWQHIGCVIIPEKPMGDIPPIPPQYYCEICRIKRADPFWVTLTYPFGSVKFASNLPTDGTNPLQNVERAFQVTSADRDLLQKAEFDVQAWCILLNDSVPFRMQWPQYANLLVNGLPVRVVNRPGSQLLGANGRDEGLLITLYIVEGMNTISLSACDARIFCFGVRFVKRRTVQQVLDLIPKESCGEPFEDALARVRRCIGGGTTDANEDSDSDLEVIADLVTINLRCPMSGSRMKIAGRFKPCFHMGCFDLETFVELNQRSRKWQCPICLRNYSLDDIIIDPYFNHITTMMRHCEEDITEIDVKPDGSWRAKIGSKFRDLSQWHIPDDSLCIYSDEVISKLETSRQINEEKFLEQNNIALVEDTNHNEIGDAGKYQYVHISGNELEENFNDYAHKVVIMSSSAAGTGSGRDDGEPSFNQDGCGLIDLSINNGNENNSSPLYQDSTFGMLNGSSSATLGDADIIILSDSEENVNLVHQETVYKSCSPNDGGFSFSATPGIPDLCVEDPGLDASMGPYFGPLNDSGNDFGMPYWPFLSDTQTGSEFQQFGTDSVVADALLNLGHTSVSFSKPKSCYEVDSKSTLISSRQVLDSSVSHPNSNMVGGLVDNPVAFLGNDPSLQNFVATQPAGMLPDSDQLELPSTSNFINNDWISLSLGSSCDNAGVTGDSVLGVTPAAEVIAESTTTSALASGNQFRSNEDFLQAGNGRKLIAQQVDYYNVDLTGNLLRCYWEKK